MDVVEASFTWDGARRDILRVFVEPTPDWMADPIDDQIVVFAALDEDEHETGGVAGIEILDFLEFDRWEDLPKLDMLWQIGGWEPLPLEELLKREQQLLREIEGVIAQHKAG